MKYLALLRGINVGGKNVVKMVALRAAFEDMGFTDVSSYIQSGNVLFQSSEKSSAKVLKKIETGLEKAFAYENPIVLLTAKQLSEAYESAPKGYGDEPQKYHYDVLFVKPPLTVKNASDEIVLREGVDEKFEGKHALFFRRLISKAGKRYLAKLVALPIYKQMTIRNWNSTSKLVEMMSE